ncbi:hypothetical protein CcCBS67573_g08009 [Chytriomyces confervae]|uniref:Integrase catalytic domain-containing protein n=1 Tax=Chytriomyces confervae TaxID=246404 RepID=A0A507ENF9_9FUNG|nr:hypothetical protein CcCBS67573_g08009 [Chytriomyces confervae]
MSVILRGKVILCANKVKEGPYTLETKKSGLATTVKEIRTITAEEAHQSMGYLNEKDVQKLNELADSIKISEEKLRDCKICTEAKITRHVNKERLAKTEAAGEKLSMDLTFKQLHTSKKPGKEKWHLILEIIKIIKKQYSHTVKTIISDGGREFVNNKFKNWCMREGVQHQVTTAYSPEQNGITERKNWTIIKISCAMLLDSTLNKTKYWTYAFEMAV